MISRKWEKRRPQGTAVPPQSSSLPHDYLRLVEQALSQSLEPGLHHMKTIHPHSVFLADGVLFEDEVIVSITLSHGEQQVAATTVYASCDYHPQTEKPTIETVLSRCVDAAGSVFEFYLDLAHPERLAQLADPSLGALEDAPFEWTLLESGSPPVWVKMDKSNPALDLAAEEWLFKNDPDYAKNTSQSADQNELASQEFFQERLEAIKKAKSGGGGDSGPIRH